MPRERAALWIASKAAMAEFFYAGGERREGGDVDGGVAAGEEFLGGCEDDVGLSEFAVGEKYDLGDLKRHFSKQSLPNIQNRNAGST